MKSTDFDHDQFTEAYPPGIERMWWQIARKMIIARAFERSVPRTANVLEVGCGTGIVTHHLRSLGWDVKGVELGTPEQGIDAREHLFLGADATMLPEHFRTGITVLALFDVIEHIPDAPGFLRHLLAAYPNAGTVVITVPARQELWTTFDDHFGHYRRYDREQLGRELTEAGLSLEWSAYFFHGLHTAITLNNTLRGRKRNVRFNAPSPGLSSALNRAIGNIFAWEAALLPDRWKGSSIVAVARRTHS